MIVIINKKMSENTRFSNKKFAVYLGDLPYGISESELKEILYGYGFNVDNLQMKKNNSTALIVFDNGQVAEQFLHQFNCSIINGTRIRATWKIEKPEIHKMEQKNLVSIDNIDQSLTETELYALFSQSGLIFSLKIHKNAFTSNTGSGFVVYYNQESCLDAERRFQNYKLGKKNLRISLCYELEKKKRGDMHSNDIFMSTHQELIPRVITSNSTPSKEENVKKPKKLRVNAEAFYVQPSVKFGGKKTDDSSNLIEAR